MKMILYPLRPIFITVLCALFLIGCAVGPDFQVPDAPSVDRYTSSPMPAETVAADAAGGARQIFIAGQDIPRQWWTLFQSETLDQLIRLSLQESPSVALAQARLREARENRAARLGAFFPSIDASASAGRQKLSGASLGQPDASIDPFSLFNATIGVSYTLDIFGGLRRQMEALDAQVEFQEYQLEGAYLMLTSNIVTSALLEASLRKQLRATEEIVNFQKEQLQLVEKRYEAGAVSLPDVLTQQTQLAQSQAALPLLEKNLSMVRHQLTVLVGKAPAEIQLPEFDFDAMSLPQELPVSMPSALVRQRPDIKAAETVLHKASAEIGVATANLYPRITLTGSYGFASNNIGDLLDSRSILWNFGAGLLQPLFQGGALTARKRAAIAVYDQALAQYRLTVLQSFQNVADVLRTLETDAKALQARATAERAAWTSLALARRQYELGAVNYLFLLNAQREYQGAAISLIQAQAARYADTAALFAALGGGWWDSNEKHVETSESIEEKRQ
ncbi:MAG: RND transporter [Deltaproteobacteria bacterium HGW-Deltaproteobacteria-6]|jgi:NodT family efflux transporter outer membrane factor (OMF) lipoprotein|nr:MAG: RND transporter [Deltaproteobacteria bacterium HGW-Deltaproteobacteria-6]